jgi:small-conductance mechanosensitive channel
MSFTYGADLEKVRALIQNEIKDIVGFVQAPSPEIIFRNLGASSIDLMASFWIDTSVTQSGPAKDDALVRFHNVLRKNEIEIPYPVQKVYVQQGK